MFEEEQNPDGGDEFEDMSGDSGGDTGGDYPPEDGSEEYQGDAHAGEDLQYDEDSGSENTGDGGSGSELPADEDSGNENSTDGDSDGGGAEYNGEVRGGEAYDDAVSLAAQPEQEAQPNPDDDNQAEDHVGENGGEEYEPHTSEDDGNKASRKGDEPQDENLGEYNGQAGAEYDDSGDDLGYEVEEEPGIDDEYLSTDATGDDTAEAPKDTDGGDEYAEDEYDERVGEAFETEYDAGAFSGMRFLSC